MPKTALFLLALTVILLTGYFTFTINFSVPKAIDKNEVETAINQAQHLYRQIKQQGGDFSNGPCLSNALLPGWVVDVVHSPRQDIDDLSQNQCAAYLEGSSKHFVELDLMGNLIRAE